MENKKMIDELSYVVVDTAEKLIKLADKYEKDRDELIERFIKIMDMASTIGTFEEYEVKNDRSNN